MPLAVFASKGISAARRERIEPAVEAAAHRPAQPYEACTAADPFRGGVRVLNGKSANSASGRLWSEAPSHPAP